MKRRNFVWMMAMAVPSAWAADSVYTSAFSNLGLSGYDPVAYFVQEAPVKGLASFELTHEGVDYRFSSERNRSLFQQDPMRYLPQYGGYCAYAVASGYTAKGDPLAWSVIDNKLYLNYSPSVRSRWLKDVTGNIARADANWPAVLD